MDITLRYAARSDVGRVRLNNQDSGFAGSHLLVVADGMGGHAGGDVASAIAVGALLHLDTPARDPETALRELERAVDGARQDLVDQTADDPNLSGMGTTVTAIRLVQDKLAMAHLGDSRAYLYRDGELSQATVDHTFVQHLVDTGRISPEEAETHPQRNVVMRVLGDFAIDLTPDLSVREARIGDRWLLCSDGLSGFVHHDELSRFLSMVDVAECADALLNQAIANKSTDNITVIIADVVATDTPMTSHVIVGAAAHPELVSDQMSPTRTTPSSSHPGDDDHSEMDVEQSASLPVSQPRRPRTRRGLFASLGIILALGVLGWYGYHWTQSQYYLGVDQGKAAIFQGIPSSLGPISLSHPVIHTDVSINELSPVVNDQLAATIPADSLSDAQTILDQLLSESPPSASNPENTSPTPQPDSTVTPSSDFQEETPQPQETTE